MHENAYPVCARNLEIFRLEEGIYIHALTEFIWFLTVSCYLGKGGCWYLSHSAFVTISAFGYAIFITSTVYLQIEVGPREAVGTLVTVASSQLVYLYIQYSCVVKNVS